MLYKYFFVCTSVVKKMFGNECEIFDVSSFHYEKKIRSNLCKKGTAFVHEQS